MLDNQALSHGQGSWANDKILSQGFVSSAGGAPKKNNTAAEKRKLRNRLSQQAFRARQNMEISELKQRLAQFSDSESDRNARLAKENQTLRQQLCRCEKRLRSLQATLKGIVDTMVEDRESSFHVDNSFPSPPSVQTSTCANDIHSNDLRSQHIEAESEYEQVLDLSMDDFNIPSGHSISGPDLGCLDISLEKNTSAVSGYMMAASNEEFPTETYPTALTVSMSTTEDVVGDDNIELATSQEFLTLPKPTSNPISSQTAENPLYRNLRQVTRSKYSEHINAYEMCVVTSYFADRRNLDLNSLNRIVSTLISAFIKIAWTNMESWIKYTNGIYTLSKLAAWRISPGPDTLAAIPRCMQPTQLQIAVPHPAVIDWCIFSFLRDKLIQYHSSDPALDEICGDIGLAYVVQADLSELVVGAEPLAVNFSIHDIISGIERNPTWCGDDLVGARPQIKLPAPSLDTLLHTKEYAQELYLHLKIGQGVDEYYLDADLFVKHPHLYEPNAKIAQGIALRSCNKLSWPKPRPLDNAVMNCYRSCASYHLNQTLQQSAL